MSLFYILQGCFDLRRHRDRLAVYRYSGHHHASMRACLCASLPSQSFFASFNSSSDQSPRVLKTKGRELLPRSMMAKSSTPLKTSNRSPWERTWKVVALIGGKRIGAPLSRQAAFVLFCASVFCLQALAATFPTDGSDLDVIAKHATASSGDTITIPAGSFSWTHQVPLTKGVKIQGAGSGRVVASSWTHNTVGTGTKTFAIQLGVAGVLPSIANGTTLRVWHMTQDKDADYMLGTVTSFVAGSLVMNITSSAGGGTHALWLFATEGLTIVKHNAGDTVLIPMTEGVAASPEISGIQFTGENGGRFISWNYTASGQPIRIHDCWFNQNVEGTTAIDNLSTDRGIIWNCSVTRTFWAQSNSQFFHSAPNARTEVWYALSTMGTADTDGKSNIYIEDCDFHGSMGSTDFDSNTKCVFRYNLCDHDGVGSHGCDTSTFGNRHWEIYNNRFTYGDVDDGDALNLINFFQLRGGTGVITDNYLDDINSGAWGPKNEYQFGVYSLGRWHPGNIAYSSDDGGAVEYPAPRQVFFGNLTGAGISAVDGQGQATRDGVTVGESEPGHIWDNTGPGGTISITTDGTPGVVNQYGNTPDDPSDYVQVNRDYFLSAKPGYTKLTYPHPLRGAAPLVLGTTTLSGSGHSTNSGSGATTIAQ
jgi:hypothetical protein